MRNFKNNRRRFRNNSFDRNLKVHSSDQSLNSGLGNVSDFKKKNFSRNNFNTTKLVQKYSDLAREALSSGDKILSENYFQHADHFTRIQIENDNYKKSKISQNLENKSVDNEEEIPVALEDKEKKII